MLTVGKDAVKTVNFYPVWAVIVNTMLSVRYRISTAYPPHSVYI